MGALSDFFAGWGAGLNPAGAEFNQRKKQLDQEQALKELEKREELSKSFGSENAGKIMEDYKAGRTPSPEYFTHGEVVSRPIKTVVPETEDDIRSIIENAGGPVLPKDYKPFTNQPPPADMSSPFGGIKKMLSPALEGPSGSMDSMQKAQGADAAYNLNPPLTKLPANTDLYKGTQKVGSGPNKPYANLNALLADSDEVKDMTPEGIASLNQSMKQSQISTTDYNTAALSLFPGRDPRSLSGGEAESVRQKVIYDKERLQSQKADAWGQNKPVPSLDTGNDNAPGFTNPIDIRKENDAAKKNPNADMGKHIPVGPGEKALNKTALMEDIRGSVNDLRGSLAAMKIKRISFTPEMRAQIAFALTARDPRSTISAFMTGQAGKMLLPEQRAYLINVTNLVENAMSMRSLLSAGQGSEDLRQAIKAVIPNETTPSDEFANEQLDRFEKTLDRLERGVPKVNLRKGSGKELKGDQETNQTKILNGITYVKKNGQWFKQ